MPVLAGEGMAAVMKAGPPSDPVATENMPWGMGSVIFVAKTLMHLEL